MGAARYIGRVGGLAVALGVGTAILTGYGVASAEPGSAASSSTSSESTSNSSSPSRSTVSGSPSRNASAASGVSGSTRAPESTQTSSDSSTGRSTPSESVSGAASTTQRATRSAPPGAVVSTGGARTSSGTSGNAGTAGGHQSTAISENSAATTQSTPPTPAANSTSQASSDTSNYRTSTSPQSTGDTSGEDATPRTTLMTGGLSSVSVAGPASYPTAVSKNVDPNSTMATNEVVVKAPSLTTWLSSPRALAGRAATPDSTLSSSSTATSGLVTSSALMTMDTATPVSPVTTPTTPISAASSVVNLVNEVLNPFAGNGPAGPVDSPTGWILAAVARRELFTAPITYAPAIALTNGVITGTDNGQMDVNGNPLTYTVVGAPSAGGKVLINSVTGDFSFLPDLSVVNSAAGTETFNVLVSETTPLIAALTQVPLVGALVQPIVVVLHQVPILGDVLQPIIGYAVTQSVVVPVGQLVDGNPVAFTTKVTSFDGTLISVNYFPASGLKTGQKAPTILNGPGLGTAGNIDPNSVTIVDDLVPGLAPLRDDGYNVVTWTPAVNSPPAAHCSWTPRTSRGATCRPSSTGLPSSPRQSSTRLTRTKPIR